MNRQTDGLKTLHNIYNVHELVRIKNLLITLEIAIKPYNQIVSQLRVTGSICYLRSVSNSTPVPAGFRNAAQYRTKTV